MKRVPDIILTPAENTSTDSASEKQHKQTKRQKKAEIAENGLISLQIQQRREERRQLMRKLKTRILSKSPSQDICLYSKNPNLMGNFGKNSSTSRFQMARMFQSSVDKADDDESHRKKVSRKKLLKTRSEANRKFSRLNSCDKMSKNISNNRKNQ